MYQFIHFIVLSFILISCRSSFHQFRERQFAVNDAFDEETSTYTFEPRLIKSLAGVELDPRCTGINFEKFGDLLPDCTGLGVYTNVQTVETLSYSSTKYEDIFRLCANHFPNVHSLRISAPPDNEFQIIDGIPLSLPNLRFLSIKTQRWQQVKQVLELIKQLNIPQIEKIEIYCVSENIPSVEWALILAQDWLKGFCYYNYDDRHKILYKDMHKVMVHQIGNVRKALLRDRMPEELISLVAKEVHAEGVWEKERIRNQAIVDKMNTCASIKGIFDFPLPDAKFLTSLRGVHIPQGVRTLYLNPSALHLVAEYKYLQFPSSLIYLDINNTPLDWINLIGILTNVNLANNLRTLVDLNMEEEDLPAHCIKENILAFQKLEYLSIKWNTLDTLLENGMIHLPKINTLCVSAYDGITDTSTQKLIEQKVRDACIRAGWDVDVRCS